jgi:hypothetical protein
MAQISPRNHGDIELLGKELIIEIVSKLIVVLSCSVGLPWY